MLLSYYHYSETASNLQVHYSEFDRQDSGTKDCVHSFPRQQTTSANQVLVGEVLQKYLKNQAMFICKL